jgi:hypothetical protein
MRDHLAGGYVTPESALIQQIRLALCRDHIRLLRNNVGALEDKNGRVVRFGLAPGSGDLIGWRTLVITPDMVGQRIAQFVSLEAKSATGRARADQIAWATAVTAAGGVAGICRTVDEARTLLAR